MRQHWFQRAVTSWIGFPFFITVPVLHQTIGLEMWRNRSVSPGSITLCSLVSQSRDVLFFRCRSSNRFSFEMRDWTTVWKYINVRKRIVLYARHPKLSEIQTAIDYHSTVLFYILYWTIANGLRHCQRAFAKRRISQTTLSDVVLSANRK